MHVELFRHLKPINLPQFKFRPAYPRLSRLIEILIEQYHMSPDDVQAALLDIAQCIPLYPENLLHSGPQAQPQKPPQSLRVISLRKRKP